MTRRYWVIITEVSKNRSAFDFKAKLSNQPVWLMDEQVNTFSIEALLSPPNKATKMDITLAYRIKYLALPYMILVLLERLFWIV